MSFQDAVRICLTQKYADFGGRARRSEYWFFQLFWVIVSFALAVVVATLGAVTQGSNAGGVIAGVIVIAVVAAAIVPGLAVTVRRLQDTDRSGWWYLISFLPLGGIVLFVFTVLDSTPDNQHGPNPKGLAAQQYYQQVPPAAPQY